MHRNVKKKAAEVFLYDVEAEDVGRALAWCTPERALRALAQLEWRHAPPQGMDLPSPSGRWLSKARAAAGRRRARPLRS
jgi:hypothetical protein